jgi:hypothetical protein
MRMQQIVGAIAFVMVAGEASAASFLITDDVTNDATTTAFVTALNTPVSPALTSNDNITPTVSYGISNAFNGAPVGPNFTSAQVTSQTNGPWNFYDDYTFTVGAGGASIQSALIAFSTGITGISNLQARIISETPATFSALANLNAPASGNTIVDSWLNTSLAGGINTVNLNATAFGPGTYDLQIRGEVGTSLSGSYGGSITFTPVPLPAALPLLLSGLGLLGIRRSRRAV